MKYICENCNGTGKINILIDPKALNIYTDSCDPIMEFQVCKVCLGTGYIDDSAYKE